MSSNNFDVQNYKLKLRSITNLDFYFFFINVVCIYFCIIEYSTYKQVN